MCLTLYFCRETCLPLYRILFHISYIKMYLYIYRPNGETLVETGNGRPRLRPLRPKCGGGRCKNPLVGVTSGTLGAVEDA